MRVIQADKCKNNRPIYILFSIFIAAVSISLLYIYIDSKVYENLDSDIFYYQAVADSLRQTGQFRNMVCNPSMAIQTPQNAASIIQYFISGVSSDPELRLRIFVIINFISLVCSVYPLLKIAGRFGISSTPVKFALTAVYLCGWHIIQFYLLPLNDGIFATCSLWLIYLVILLTEKDLTIRELLSSQRRLFLTIIILSAVLIHFRVNVIFIPVAAGLATILIKRYRPILPMILLCIIMFLSITIPYLFIDTSRIEIVTDKTYQNAVRLLPPDHLY